MHGVPVNCRQSLKGQNSMQDEFNPDPDEEYYNNDPDEEYSNTDDPNEEYSMSSGGQPLEVYDRTDDEREDHSFRIGGYLIKPLREAVFCVEDKYGKTLGIFFDKNDAKEYAKLKRDLAEKVVEDVVRNDDGVVRNVDDDIPF